MGMRELIQRVTGSQPEADSAHVKYPGTRVAVDGNTAAILCERESSDAAGAYPITPSTQMGEYWAEASAKGHINISGRPLIFIEPEGEHAAAAVTAGLAMTGLRSANFSSGQGIAYMHESLYAAVGKRLTYVLNIGARAMTKANLNVHAGHDDYHCIDDTGFFQVFAKNAQHVADLNLCAHRIAELALTPGVVAQDGFLTTHLIESMQVPERELIAEFLGKPEDVIETPTPAQRIIYGATRRRIPELWDVDNPVMAGLVQNQDSYMQSVAAQRPYFFDHIQELTDRAFAEFAALTGRQYARVMAHRMEDAEYVVLGQGSVIPSAEAVADYLRETRGLKVGVVDLVMFRPFPSDLLVALLKGRKGVAVLERLDQPLAVDLPVVREIRAAFSRAFENGRDPSSFPGLGAFTSAADAPPLYSGSFGMGSRDLQPGDIIGAVENMLPDGAHKRFFYLSIDFLRDRPYTPKQAIHQENIAASYPNVKELAVKGSENPNLMPDGAITVRFHSVGGWGAITTGKNLAMTLFDLLGWHVKANPKYGSEKKGQPTTYYLSAAPEPIRVNCEYYYVDAVLSPDPNVFAHTNALAGLREGGLLIIQSELKTPEQVWAHIPELFQKLIVKKDIQVYALDGFKIAREEATDSELQFRMQGIAFQGAFFARSPQVHSAGFSDEELLQAIHDQIDRKFGAKGARIVEDNVRVVKRGFTELFAVPHGEVGAHEEGEDAASDSVGPAIPVMLKRHPKSAAPSTDTHRFWEQTGSFYARGLGNDNLADPFISLGTMPALSATFRDMTGIRFEHPEWVGENCTACAKCYTVCPDTAIPGLVTEVTAVFDTALARVKKSGPVTHLPKAVRECERHLRAIFDEAEDTDRVGGMLDEAIAKTVGAWPADTREEVRAEFGRFEEALNDFQLALTRPHWTAREKQQKGNGGLLSITINPYTCKGCMECVAVCDDDALRPITQTPDSVAKLRDNWDFWLELPNTPEKFIRVDDLEEGIGALETILLDKRNYLSVASGDGACLGCSEKTAIRLFVATVEALMQGRIKKHLAKLDDLIARLEQHLQLELVQEITVGDPATISSIVADLSRGDVTLAGIAARVEQMTGGNPIDPEWLQWVTGVLSKLKSLKWRYTDGITGAGRSSMGMINATGCTSVWGSTWPYNPYPFPWANHLFQDTASMAMGVFEGHMSKMAEGFKAIRMAEIELSEGYDARKHDERFQYFNWRHFTDDEWELCPPVAVVGGDGAMYDIGFQNLSRAMMSGKPVKIVVVDTQVYSNTGGQACTSGFIGQISDMAQYGKAQKGKEEARKEIGLIAMAHRTTYVMQSTIAHPAHMIESFIQGLKARRPALFSLYTSCQPEHGIGDDMGYAQAKMAVESRAYPLFRYDPDRGKTPAECFDLEGNPAIGEPWPVYTLHYREGERKKSMELPLTFADFAATESRFRKHYRTAPPDTWNDTMLPVAEFLDLEPEDREGLFPFVWTVDTKGRLTRLLVSSAIIASCEDRADFWTMLQALSGEGKQEVDRGEVEAQVQADLVARLAQGLMQLVGGETAAGAAALLTAPAASTGDNGSGAATGDYSAPWIETEACTACDECIKINPKVFKYNDQKKAYIADPDAGPYQDLVKAAERCTALVIHPGLPRDRSAKGVDKLIKRAEKFN